MAIQPIVALCMFGFLKEFRPSESFLTPYLCGSFKNFTREEIYQEIYPFGTYSTLLLLVVVFLVTDALCYKPIIVVQGLAGIIISCLIIWSSTIPWMQVCEFFYGLFIASDVAYATYIYTYCEKEEYRKVTSYTRIALQCGRFMSGILGQFVVSFYFLNYHELNYVTLTSLLLATLCSSLLPSSGRSLYFNHMPPTDGDKCIGSTSHNTNPEVALDCVQDRNEDTGNSRDSCAKDEVSTILLQNPFSCGQSKVKHKSGLALIWFHFYNSYSDFYVVRWSLWWALTHCGYLQVSSYVQNLWQDTVDINGDPLYNGAASAVYAITGILATWAVGQVGFAFERYSHWLLAAFASIAGILVVWSTFSYSLLLQYVSYGMFKVLYQVMMTLANSEVAKSVTRDTHGLVFGFNTFVALLLQTILTTIVVAKGGLELPIRTQFLVYGAYFCVISVGFGAAASFTSITKCKNSQHPSQENENIT